LILRHKETIQHYICIAAIAHQLLQSKRIWQNIKLGSSKSKTCRCFAESNQRDSAGGRLFRWLAKALVFNHCENFRRRHEAGGSQSNLDYVKSDHVVSGRNRPHLQIQTERLYLDTNTCASGHFRLPPFRCTLSFYPSLPPFNPPKNKGHLRRWPLLSSFKTVPPGSQAIEKPSGTDTLNQNTVGIQIDKIGYARGITNHHTVVNACTDGFFLE
jgi:hypothetical protein